VSPPDHTDSELVEAYIIAIGVTGDDSFSWANDELMCLVWEDPERAWPIIMSIAERDLPTWQLAILAAGPLEDLLQAHGLKFIDRVEQKALQSESFRKNVLARIYPDACRPDEVADRVRALRGVESPRPHSHSEKEAQQ
jgi:hypothetical protein